MNDGERCIDAGITNNCELTVLQKTVPGVTPTAGALQKLLLVSKIKTIFCADQYKWYSTSDVQ